MGMRGMPPDAPVVDCFGAHEYYVTEFVREELEPGIVRVLAITKEGGERIVRCKLVMSATTMSKALSESATFLEDITLAALPLAS